MKNNLSWQSEVLALVFGALTIVNVFEDGRPLDWVGNLDTIFGLRYYPFMDVVYFGAPIAVFLLYGKSKGRIQCRTSSVSLFLGFLAALVLLRLDDFLAVLHFVGLIPSVRLPLDYWIAASLLYLFTSVFTFFAFGRVCMRSAGASASLSH